MAAAPAPDAAWYVARVKRVTRLRRWIGHSGMSAIMATQLGLAMTPRWRAMAAALISGTTRGTAASRRNAEELSITTAPRLTAAGAYRLATSLPAAKSAMSTLAKASSANAATMVLVPQAA